ncbi:sialate O-acetylesterase [Sphingomonas horti]
MVVALLGQSNAANYAEHRSAAVDPRISVFYHGKCYEARDPLLGATGFRGSVWPTFAKTIVKSGKFDQVVLVPAAIGGTPLVSWAPGGIYWDRVVSRISGLRRAGLKVTHFLIGQGEREANSGEDGVVYKQHAVRLLLALRATGAEVYFATTGQCSGAQNNRIRFAQESARLETGTFAGPDMDLVGPEHRVRGCHLDDFGTRMVALGWANAVINPSG